MLTRLARSAISFKSSTYWDTSYTCRRTYALSRFPNERGVGTRRARPSSNPNIGSQREDETNPSGTKGEQESELWQESVNRQSTDPKGSLAAMLMGNDVLVIERCVLFIVVQYSKRYTRTTGSSRCSTFLSASSNAIDTRYVCTVYPLNTLASHKNTLSKCERGYFGIHHRRGWRICDYLPETSARNTQALQGFNHGYSRLTSSLGNLMTAQTSHWIDGQPFSSSFVGHLPSLTHVCTYKG
jgi:hypothetical protein